PRKKATFKATVTDDRWIRLMEPPHDEFQKLSQAAYAAGEANRAACLTGEPDIRCRAGPGHAASHHRCW
ncbi:MAG: hypothetical protein M3P18_26935, partial [Actinomycetota bacterium]|nr:hypothetical protein [Actinomycetota bacterium]